MEIYIADIYNFNSKKLNEYISLHNEEYNCQNETKRRQHFLALYIAQSIGKEKYGIINPEICYRNKKPCFVNSKINISISHSNNIVAVAFSDFNIGLDIEYNEKKRNFKKILQRYNFNISDENDEILQKTFYDFWTIHEAKIKLNSTESEIYSQYDYSLKNFTLCAVCETPFKITNIIFKED